MKNHPTIIIDTREQRPLVFEHLPSQPGTLTTGDYSLENLEAEFSVERKSIPDLISSCLRDRVRFEKELARLRGFQFARVLVVGQPHDIAKLAPNPKSIFSTISAFEARYVPFVFEPDPATSARLVERWAWFFWQHRARPFRTGGKAETCPILAATVQGRTRDILAASNPLASSNP